MKLKASKDLGQYLRTKRETAKLSQRQVAKMFNYASSQFVSNWERGKAAPPIETLKKLKEVYHLETKEVAEIISRNVCDNIADYLNT